jgi:hypothetical protein
VPDHDATQHDTAGPDEAALAIVARHALHDEELVAALAAGARHAARSMTTSPRSEPRSVPMQRSRSPPRVISA